MSFLPSDAESSDGPLDGGSFAPSTFQGYLQKKSPKGFFGKHLWQRRFFVLEQGNLSYHKDKQGWAKGEKPIGVVRVDMIRDIQLPIESTHYGFRFDILAVGGHLFELMAPSEKSCTQWVRALRDEISKRTSTVNEALRTIKDEHVADGFWKSRDADTVKKLQQHAESAVPEEKRAGRASSKQTSRVGSRANSRESSRSRTFEPDEDAEERAAALAQMMAEQEAREGNGPTPAASLKRAGSSSSLSGGTSATPPRPPVPLNDEEGDPEEEETPEQKAANFLKRQYTLGAVKAGGRKAIRASIVHTSALDIAEIEAQLPANQRGAAREIVAKSLKNNQSFDSSNSPQSTPPTTTNGMPPASASSTTTAVGAATSPPQRRPIASYGSDDSDDETPSSTTRGAPVVRYHTDDGSSANGVAASSSSAAAAAAAASSSPTPATPSAAPDDSPFISTILWKESPSAIYKAWQKRLFALQDGVVCYYKKADAGLKKSNLAGTISVHQMTKVVLVSNQKPGKATDFNICTTEGRVYKLRSESEEITKQWIAFIQACDSKRLGCSYPGLVIRESKEDAQSPNGSANGNGTAPRGRLVAAGTGRTVVSVLPGGANGSSSTHTAELPPTPSQKAAAEELTEPKTFWNFLRNKHSLLSIFFVKKKAAFPRMARWFLFLLDLVMNLFFVYVFIIDGRLTPVEQVVAIIFLLIIIEMVLAWFLRWFCYSRDIGPIEQQIRLAVCAVTLLGLFVGLTAWQWTLLPESSAIIALVRFIASSIGVILLEIGIWAFLYSCAQECCPCIKLDNGAKSLEDIQAEEEEKARIEREAQRKVNIEIKRAKMKRHLEVKSTYRADEEV